MSLTSDEKQQLLNKTASYGRLLGNDIITSVKMGCFHYDTDDIISFYFNRYFLQKELL